MMRLIFAREEASVLFIALALGFLVCHLAKKESGFLKKVGYGIGILIIVSNMLFLFGKLYMRLKACCRNNAAAMMQYK